MKPETLITKSDKETKKLGEKLARNVLKNKLKDRAFVIGLIGELGGGKTTFLQGLAKGLGIQERVLSPTFVIYKRFQVLGFPEAVTSSKGRYGAGRFHNFYHFDCYRIKSPKEILDLGFKDIISDSRNIVAIEWADRIKKIMPENTLWIKFEFIDEKKRKIVSVF